MRRTFLLLGLTGVALGACAAGRAEEGGAEVRRSYDVGAFERIEVAGPYDVTVTTGGRPGAQAQGTARLLDKTEVMVEGGTLHIRPQRSGWFGGFQWGGGKARFGVSTQMLRGAAVAGSGDITVNRVQADSFDGSIAGSGNLRLGETAVQRLGLEIAGSGGVDAGTGRVREASYQIAGSGSISAERIAAERVKAEIAGSGNIGANASGTADVDIAGSGNVRVTGGAKCSVSKAGSGSVDCS